MISYPGKQSRNYYVKVCLVRKEQKKAYILLYASTFVWMGVIFFFSSQPSEDSSELSSFVVEWIFAFLRRIFSGEIPSLLEAFVSNAGFFVRKGGHVAEYFILGLLVVYSLKKMAVKRYIPIALLICMLYAVSDEVHQAFVPGRGPAISDVLLDSAASAAGIAIAWLTGRLKRSK
jgi:VanZ family protein